MVQVFAHEAPADVRGYRLSGRDLNTASPDLADAVATAHAARGRPRCLCQPGGIEMYVARSSAGYLLKRMPNTGWQHAPDCPSYEPVDASTGWGEVAGSAITEDPVTGETVLKLGFPLSKLPGRTAVPGSSNGGSSAATPGARLSLRGLLHYLWHEAGLTRWHPGFAGKRTWGIVRHHLVQAAEHKLANGCALGARLYVPEAFSVDQRDAISARRLAQWRGAVQVRGRPQQLQLLIAEVKEIVPARYGYKAIVKHLPDQAFAIDEQLYQRLGRRFEAELSLWGANEQVRMVAVATFGVSEAGVPSIAEISLMPVTRQWLPIENSFELELIERLVREQRSFVKGLRYNLGADAILANATLTDTGATAVPLCIVSAGVDEAAIDLALGALTDGTGSGHWRWEPSAGAMPALPGQVRGHTQERDA